MRGGLGIRDSGLGRLQVFAASGLSFRVWGVGPSVEALEFV